MPASIFASRAVPGESAVIVAPLSISIRRLTPLIEASDPEMAVVRHADAKLLAGDFLVVEAKPVGEAGQLRLIGRLLEQDENEEGEEAGGKSEADDAADEGECAARVMISKAAPTA